MLLLIFFAFLAGFVTILSPCILPILPIVLSGSITGDKKRPIAIVIGFIASFTFFTLFLSTLVRSFGISADTLRMVSVIIIAGFGATLLIPKFQAITEHLFSMLSARIPRQHTSGILIGLSLGLIWTPCVGPILASIITLAATNALTAGSVAITLAYSIGTAIPLLAITYGGRQLLQKVPWLLINTLKIQKIFGIVMI